jgi:hypothetical protein
MREILYTAMQMDNAQITEAYYLVIKRLKEVTEHNLMLIKKIEKLGGNSNQLELDF